MPLVFLISHAHSAIPCNILRIENIQFHNNLLTIIPQANIDMKEVAVAKAEVKTFTIKN